MSCKQTQLKTLLDGLDRLNRLSQEHADHGIRWHEQATSHESDHITICMDAMERIQRLAGQRRASRSMAELIVSHLKQPAAAEPSLLATTQSTNSENQE